MSATVIYIEHCLCPHRRNVDDCAGKSIAELDPRWRRPYIAVLDGQAVVRHDWHLVLRPGHVLVFVDASGVPQGGGGSNPLQIVAQLAVIAAGVWTGGFVTGLAGSTLMGSVASAAVMVAGGVLVNALAPAPTTSLSNQQLPAASPTYSLQAQGNTARLEAPIPEHFGRHMCYPDYASTPFQEFSGNDQYLYSLLCLGRGHYNIEGIYIEDTKISVFDGVNIEVVNPGETLDLFPGAVETSDEVAGQDMETGSWVGPFVANQAGTTANSIGIDFIAPKGLFYAEDDGSLDSKSVTVAAEARLINDNGAAIGEWFSLFPLALVPQKHSNLPFTDNDDTPTTWTPVTQQKNPAAEYTYEKTYTAATTTPQRYSEKFIVPAGRYEVRVQRTSSESTSSRSGHEFQWAGLRAYLKGPSTFGDVTLIGVRMKATEQLSSISARKIKVVATRKLPIWNGSAWTAPTATRSIAWAFAYVAKQAGIPDTRLDLTTLRALDAVWAARGDQCNGRFDNHTTIWEALTQIAAAGRAKPYMQGGVVRIFRDQQSSLPVALFSQRNILSGSFSVDYIMPSDATADAVDVGYFDETVWAQRRVRAAVPGSLATKPTKIELSLVTRRAQAYREGVYQAACNRYRRKLIKFGAEMEGFIPSFGDLIAIQHDMPGWGQVAEVVSWDAGLKELIPSEPFRWDGGPNFYIALKRPDGSMNGPIEVWPGPDTEALGTVYLMGDMPDFTIYTGQTHERTVVVFGWGDTWGQLARVLSVRPTGLHTAEIEAINEDDNVHIAELGQIEPSPETSQLPGVTVSPEVAGLTGIIMPGDSSRVILSWDPAPWADYYLVEISADGKTWAKATETRTANCVVKALYAKMTVVRVAAVGLQQGPWAVIRYSDFVASAWDPSLSMFTATVSGASVVLQWDPSGDWDVAGYEIRIGPTWDAGQVIATGHKSGTFVWPPTIDGDLVFRLKAIDRYGVYSLEEATQRLTVSLPVITSFAQQVIDNNVLLSWSISPGTFPVDRTEVRRGLSFATAEIVGYIKGTFVPFFETQSGTYKYWVVPINTAGMRGAEEGIYAVVSEPPDYVLQDKRSLAVALGTKTNALVDNGMLYAPINTTETFDQHFLARSWATTQAQIDAGYPYFLQPGVATGAYTEIIDYGATLPSTKITLSITRVTVAGNVTVTPTISTSLDGELWINNPGVYEIYATDFRYVKIRLDFASADGGFLKITGSQVRLDVKMKTLQGKVAAVSTDAGGTAVDITGKFIDIQSLTVSPNGTTPSFAIADFVDTANPTSFKVLLYNTAGTRISGTVSYTIRGV